MRIVLNPGHSTTDPGAIGYGGITEAEIARAVVREMIKLGGYEAKRQEGGFLEGLLKVLRLKRPDLLVSVHCNGYAWEPGGCLHRAEFYYWRNEPDFGRRAESLRLAMKMARYAKGVIAEQAEVRTFPIDRNGKQFTPGILKRTAKRAAVLVELGYAADPHVAAAMRQPGWQQAAARALDRAIREWAA